MTIPGSRLAHYEVVEAIGKGGMGEVWKARDTKLGREVAIKTLPSEFADDPDRLARFEREAKLFASLNHPNIAAIYGLEEHEGSRFLVLELAEGDTLADRLKRGAIPIQESLKLALQIAEALEAAHEKGVIHRDLKPANIKLTDDGKVKVLDFGLAKAFAGDEADVNLSNSPTLSMQATQAGIILGTAAYMSPEQASGKETDRRADVWSFGVVLFEMLSGKQVFDGETVSHVLAAVLAKDPNWDRLPHNLHPRLRLLLERCVAKELKDRYTGIGDARVDIEKVLADPDGVLVNPVADSLQPARQSKLTWAAAVVIALFVGGGAIWLLTPEPPRPVSRWDHVLPEGREFFDLAQVALAISPDGNQIVYNASGGLYLRSIDEREDRVLVGTAGRLTNPTFSPDGESLVFWSEGDRQLKKIAVAGGVEVTITSVEANPRGISWTDDETILYQTAEGPMRVSADGGEPELLVAVEGAASLQLLPDGNTILYRNNSREVSVVSIDSGQSTPLFPGVSPRLISTGHIVYGQEDVLYAVPFDARRLEVTGGQVPLVEGVRTGIGDSFAQYAVSDSGVLAFIPGTVSSGTAVGALTLVDENGVQEVLSFPPGPYARPRLSPDGSRLVVEVIGDGGTSGIRVSDDLSGNSQLRRLGDDQYNNIYPIWTPDGERITYASERAGAWGIYWQRADGSDEAQPLPIDLDGIQTIRPDAWSNDGTTLIFMVTGAPDTTGSSLWTLSVETEQVQLFHDSVGGAQSDEGPVFSPSGDWVAYSAGGTNGQIFIKRFPEGETQQVTENGGNYPVWGRDGTELFYRPVAPAGAASSPSSINRVGITTDPFIRGREETLPIEGFLINVRSRDYDITQDGQRFLMVFPEEDTASLSERRSRISVTLNWHQELLERVPVD